MDALAEAFSELLALHAWEIIAPTVAALTPSENSLAANEKSIVQAQLLLRPILATMSLRLRKVVQLVYLRLR